MSLRSAMAQHFNRLERMELELRSRPCPSVLTCPAAVT